MNREEVVGLLRLIKGTYGNKFELNEFTSDAWEYHLREITFSAALSALEAWKVSEDESFAPDAIQILRLARKSLLELPYSIDASEGFEMIRYAGNNYNRSQTKTKLSNDENPKIRRLGPVFFDRIIDCEGEQQRAFCYRDFKTAWDNLDDCMTEDLQISAMRSKEVLGDIGKALLERKRTRLEQ